MNIKLLRSQSNKALGADLTNLFAASISGTDINYPIISNLE